MIQICRLRKKGGGVDVVVSDGATRIGQKMAVVWAFAILTRRANNQCQAEKYFIETKLVVAGVDAICLNYFK